MHIEGPRVRCPQCGSFVPLASSIGIPGDNVWLCEQGHRFGPRVDREAAADAVREEQVLTS